MDVIQRGIITLIKSAVLQQSFELPEGFSIEEAYPQIKRHSLIALCYDGAVRCGLPKSDPVMKKLFQGYLRYLQISEGQMRQVERICKAFDENGIDYMPLKGVNMKKLYPAPELRAMGDADILIRVEQYDKIVPILEGMGYQAGPECDHQLVWDNAQLHLELHKKVIPEYNRDLYSYFEHGWHLAHIHDKHLFKMDPEDEYLFEVAHFAKHFRNGGIGCRHVADLWLYQTKHLELNMEYVEAGLKRMKLEQFHGKIQSLISNWFEDVQSDVLTDFLTEYVFSSGNWGTTESLYVSKVLRMEKEKSDRSGKLGYIMSCLFPTVDELKDKHPVLRTVPWLLPAVWIYRPVHKLLFERRELIQYVKTLNFITREKIDEKQEMLHSVGLDFNF